MAKPLPEKLNPAWQAAVRHMLATPPQPKKAVKKKPPKAKKYRYIFCSDVLESTYGKT
jgi:hypothetical protein